MNERPSLKPVFTTFFVLALLFGMFGPQTHNTCETQLNSLTSGGLIDLWNQIQSNIALCESIGAPTRTTPMHPIAGFVIIMLTVFFLIQLFVTLQNRADYNRSHKGPENLKLPPKNRTMN